MRMLIKSILRAKKVVEKSTAFYLIIKDILI